MKEGCATTDKSARVLFLLPLKTVQFEALESLVVSNCDVLVLLHGVSNRHFRKYESLSGPVFKFLSQREYKNLSALLNYGLEWAEQNGYEYAARIDGADKLIRHIFRENLSHVVNSDVSFAAFSRRRKIFQNKNQQDLRAFSFWDVLIDNTFIHSTFILKLKCGYTYDIKKTFAQDFAFAMRNRRHLAVLPHCHVVKGFVPGGASEAKRIEQLLSSIVTLLNEGKSSLGWLLALLPRILKIWLLLFRRVFKYN